MGDPRAFDGLTEVANLAHGTAEADNLLIHGDNLEVLQSLFPAHVGSVQCVYLDPPELPGRPADYDDAGRDRWLAELEARLALLREFLDPSGHILVSVVDHQAAYVRVVLDHLFGRGNYVGAFVWEKQGKANFSHSSIGQVTEPILVYARRREYARPLTYGKTPTGGKRFPLNEVGRDIKVITFPRGSVEFGCGDGTILAGDMSEGPVVTRLLDAVEIKRGRNVESFRLEGQWRYSARRVAELASSGEKFVISKVPFRPNHVKAGGEPKKVHNLLNREHYKIPTIEDANAESRLLFGADAMFKGAKPEALMEFLIGCATDPGDRVLDPYAGSGTTGAVAHKLWRRWIMIESGKSARAHARDRLARVVDGREPGGITANAGWRGGGGFRFFRTGR